MLICSLGAIDRTVYLQEDFSSNVMPPTGWTISGHAENWRLTQSMMTGGLVPELKFVWYPVFDGQSYFISPQIDTSEATNLLLDFRQFYDYHNPGPVLSVVTRSGEGPWTTVWTAEGLFDLSARLYTVEIDNPDVGSPTFQFAFVFEGNSFDTDGWYLDDIKLYKIDLSDLMVVDAMPHTQVASGTTVNPYCVIRNQGNYSIVAKASMLIYLNDNLIESWANFMIQTMEPLAELRVDFPSHTTSVSNASYRIEYTVASQEGTEDENPDNNLMVTKINTWNIPKQKVLLELGTGIWSAELNNCYGAILAAEQFATGAYPVAVLNHMSGPPYANDDSEARILYYNMSHLPTAVFDGSFLSEANSSTASVFDSYLPLYEEAAGIKAPLTLELRGSYSAPEYHYQVVINKAAYTDTLNCRLHLVLSKDNQAVNWMGLNHLDHVTWDFVTDGPGSLIEIPNPVALDRHFNLTRLEGADFYPSDYVLTAFLQDARSKKIIQCESKPLAQLLAPVGNSDLLESPVLAEIRLWPNPFRDNLRVEYEVRQPQNVKLEIFNLRGQLLQSYAQHKSTAGRYSFDWDGKDASGTKLPVGTYLLKLSAGGKYQLKKTLLID